MAKKNVIIPGAQVPHVKPYENVFRDRVAELPLDKVMIYLIDTVDAKALPFLAEQFNVLGNRGWRFATNENRQRALLKRAIYLHKIEGTEAAIIEALKIIGIENATILHPIPGNTYNGQWSHNGSITYGGAYHWACFKVLVNYLDLIDLPEDTVEIAVDLINEWKNVRSLLIGVEAMAELNDEVKVTDAVEIEVAYELNEQLGPNLYDGSITYGSGATHSGGYDEVEFSVDSSLAKVFNLFTNAEPANSPITMSTALNASALWSIRWPDGSSIGYSNAGSFGVEGYIVPPQDLDDIIEVGVDDADKITEISVTSGVVAGFELSAPMANLVLVAVTNCALEIFTTNGETLPALVDIQLSGNKLSVAEVNNILALIAANGVANGTLDLSGQTPPAPPSGSGLTAKAALEADGWTVLTD